MDVEKFFDHLQHSWLLRFLEHRIADKRVLRLIRKWLRAGVMDEGRWYCPEEGSPQCSAVSPLLANIYLHYVFDLWSERRRRTQLRGAMIVVRYGDDMVVGFEQREEAEAFLQDVRRRFNDFGLQLHSGRPASWSLAAQRWPDERAREKANRRPSTSWGLHTSAHKPEPADSPSGARPLPSAVALNCELSRQSCVAACTPRDGQVAAQCSARVLPLLRGALQSRCAESTPL